MRHIIPISGKDSLATAIVQLARKPDLDYEYVFNPTGLELPEVFVWLDKVELYLEKPIKRVGKDLKEIIESYNYFLPNMRDRYCTRRSKIEPFEEFINGEDCIVYYGIRSDEQTRMGYDNSKTPHITPVYPLIEMNIDLKGVYLILNLKNLKPPAFFWESVYNAVKIRLGYDPKGNLPEWVFDVLFAWRTRANCDRCPNQRKYEWCGLLEHHPELFEDASDMEHKGSTNYDRSEGLEPITEQTLFGLYQHPIPIDNHKGMFTWNGNESLDEIKEQKDKIIEKRVKHILKVIRQLQQTSIFDDNMIDENFMDFLSVTSCGLMCGK